jgi:histone deacetylase 1/2
MPTPVLQNQSPFECLFNRTPDYDFLRTFKCLCFPFMHPYHAHKLDFRSSPCVFLGYSSSHLGYRCLDSASDRIYVSRHVRFHENVFPFADSSQLTRTPAISSQPTHLPNLITPYNFLPATPQNASPASSATPQAPTKQPYRSLPMSTTIPPPPSPTPMSASACFSNDHCRTSPARRPMMIFCLFA